MRLAVFSSLAVLTLLVATATAEANPANPSALDMCAVEGGPYASDLYDNGWVTDLAAKRAAGTVICDSQSMHRLGEAGGRSYVYWDALFSEIVEGYDGPRHHVVAQIGEYDTDGKLTIVIRTSRDGDKSELDASVIERDGETFIPLTDPEARVYVRRADGFVPASTDLDFYSLDGKIVLPVLPGGYVATAEPGDDGDTFYRVNFDVADLALDLPVAVRSEVFPRTYVNPDYDRALTLRLRLEMHDGKLATGAAEVIEPTPVPTGIGETPEPFAVPKDTAACTLYAYVEDDDPAGVSVRAAPDAKSQVIADLPAGHQSKDGDYAFGAEVDVIGSIDGWFLIENAVHPAENYGDVTEGGEKLGAGSDLVRRTYRGRGWIHGSRLTTGLQLGTVLRAGADLQSKPVFDLKFDSSGEGYVDVETFKSCKGDALEVTLKRQDGVEGSGWLGGGDGTQLCANQATTCS
jgi:hypothetical protein